MGSVLSISRTNQPWDHCKMLGKVPYINLSNPSATFCVVIILERILRSLKVKTLRIKLYRAILYNFNCKIYIRDFAQHLRMIPTMMPVLRHLRGLIRHIFTLCSSRSTTGIPAFPSAAVKTAVCAVWTFLVIITSMR